MKNIQQNMKTGLMYKDKMVIHQLSANAYQLSAENAINSAQDFYRV